MVILLEINLRNPKTGGADSHQLPYMNTSIREFGKKGTSPNSSHLWKDSALSVPIDEGYYVHSFFFLLKKVKIKCQHSFGNANHTSSFFVFGAFIYIHLFLQLMVI